MADFELFGLPFGFWMSLCVIVAFVLTIVEFSVRLFRRFRSLNNDDSSCPMIVCHNTSCDHYLSQYNACRYSQYPIEDSVLRSWILRYVDVNGVDKLYELISGKEASDD